MIVNYFKIAIRNILRHKVYSFINIMGLAVGMACCILILLWVQDEMSYDRFHENADDIYRVIQNINFADHSTTWAITQGPLGPSLKEDFPEIINATRMRHEDFLTLTYNDKTFDETGFMVDGSIFEMFSFSLIKGDSATALSDPHSIVLSKELAQKYFGDEDSLGKTITLNHKYDFEVTGVLEDIPQNSSIKPNLLIPFIFGREVGWTVDRWNNSFIQTFVQLKDDIPYQDVVQKISEYLHNKPTIEKDSRLNLQPLKKIHLYSNKFPTDASEAVIVNEAAIKAMRMESPIGKRLTKDGKQYKIVGVVKNYHFKSLHHKIEPLILLYRQKPGHILVAKIRPGSTPEIIRDIEKIWKNFEPGYPVIYRFTDELLDDLYTSEKRIEKLFRYFSILSIFIACLGLFGLASFTAEQRTKEIGIRKALGASVSEIIFLLSKDFTKWVIVANIIAWPMAYYAMNRWLQNFAYRINIGIGTFTLAALLALVIALLTVGYQAVRAARVNPVEALRYE
jgi:ABC-type antimicrobial peptide transport system permease subunit